MKNIIDKTVIEVLRYLLFCQSVNTKSMVSNSIWNAVRSELNMTHSQSIEELQIELLRERRLLK